MLRTAPAETRRSSAADSLDTPRTRPWSAAGRSCASVSGRVEAAGNKWLCAGHGRDARTELGIGAGGGGRLLVVIVFGVDAPEVVPGALQVADGEERGQH